MLYSILTFLIYVACIGFSNCFKLYWGNSMINKQWLSCAKLKLSYVKVKVEVKFEEEVVVNARVQLLVCQVGGRIKRN